MNGPFRVAQVTTTTAGNVRVIKIEKPQGGQALTAEASYDGTVKVDFSSIANEKITLVHIGERLIILFDNQSTVTIVPFFDSMGVPLANLTIESDGKEFSGAEFASTFPITTDQSVLPAAGDGTPASGANFSNASVDPLLGPDPLPLLPPEALPPIEFTRIEAVTPQQDLLPSTGPNDPVSIDEDDISSAYSQGIGNIDSPGDDNPINLTGTLNFTPGDPTTTVDFASMDTLVVQGADSKGNVIALTSQGHDLVYMWDSGASTLKAVWADQPDHVVFQIAVDPTSGDYTLTLLDQLDHPYHDDPSTTADDGIVTAFEDNLIVDLIYTVTDGDGQTATGSLSVDFDDDMPRLTGAIESRIVDEDDIKTAWSHGTSPDDGSADGSITENSTGAAFISGSLGGLVSLGADEFPQSQGEGEGQSQSGAIFGFTSDVIQHMEALGLYSKQSVQPATENGLPLYYQTSTDGPWQVLSAFEPDTPGPGDTGNPVFELRVNQFTGEYEFRLFDELIHQLPPGFPNGADENFGLRSGEPDPITGQAIVNGLDFGSIITVTDYDGDSITLGGQFLIQIRDDVPDPDIDLTHESVIHDETPGDDGADDESFNSLPSSARTAFTGVTNTGNDPDVPEVQLGAIGFAHDNDPIVVNGTSLTEYGADHPAASSVFSLAIVGGNGIDSGLDITEGFSIFLFKEGDVIVGRVQGGDFDGQAAFAVHLNQNGEISVAQWLSIKHDDRGDFDESNDNGNNSNDALPDDPLTIQQTLSGKINAVLTITDSDGDSVSDSIGVGDRVIFQDDGPSFKKLESNQDVTHDETPGLQNNDVLAANVPQAALDAFTAISNQGDDPDVPPDSGPIGYAVSNGSIVTVQVNYGADGKGADLAYALVLDGNNRHSGLTTTDGRDIHLFKEGNVIVGRYEVGGDNLPDGYGNEPAAFAIYLDPATGQVSVVQYVSLHHPDSGNPDDQVDIDGGLLYVGVTAVDGDGDPLTEYVDIGSRIEFDDDGPTATFALQSGVVIHDETVGVDAGSNDVAPGTLSSLFSAVSNKGNDPDESTAPEPEIGYAQSVGSLVTVTSVNYGADGPAAGGGITYSLDIPGSSALSGLMTTEGLPITLFQVNSQIIVGRYDGPDGGSSVGTNDPAAFAIQIDPTTGVVTVVQYVSLKHDDRGDPNEANDNNTDANDAQNPNDSPEPGQQWITNGNLQIVATATDGDGDHVSQSFDIGNKIIFLDDGPTVSVTSAEVIHDETPGLQGDANDTSNSLPSAFSTRLSALGVGSEIGHARGGAGEVTFNAGVDGLKNVALTDANGAALHGVDSGLDKTGGSSIFLYTDPTNDNIVLGREGSNDTTPNPTGQIVFAIYLDQSTGETWLTQYGPIEHPIPLSSHDESVSITNKIYVTVTDNDDDSATSLAAVTVTFQDDGPSAVANNPITLDEDDIPGANGNPDGPGDANPPGSPDHTIAGTLGHTFGTDGAGSIDFAAMGGTSQLVNGVTVNFSWDGGTHTLTANDGEQNVFEVVVDNPATGAYHITLLNALRHHPDANADNLETDAQFTLTYTITDGDGDTATGSVSLTVDDDTPTVTAQSICDDTPPEAAKVANFVLVLDSSGSIDSAQLALIKSNAINFLNSVAGSGAGDVRVHIVDFDDNSRVAGTFDLVIGGEPQDNAGDLKGNQLQAAIDAVNALVGGGHTNYEAALSQTNEWITGGTVTITAAHSFDADTNSGNDTAYVLTDNNGVRIAVVSAWEPFASNTLTDVEGNITNGFGVASDDNLNDTDEMLRFDFGAFNDVDNGGEYGLAGDAAGFRGSDVATATFSLRNFGSGNHTVFYKVFYADGTNSGAVLLQFNFNGATSSNNAIQAPAGKLIDYIEFTVPGSVNTGRIDLESVTVGSGPLPNADINEVIFLSDGEPNRALDSNGNVTEPSSTQNAINESLNEISAIETDGDGAGVEQPFTIQVFGINADGTGLGILNQVDSDNAQNITDANGLTTFLSGLIASLGGSQGGDNCDPILVHDETQGVQVGADPNNQNDASGASLPPAILTLFNAIAFKGVDPDVTPDNGAIGFARSGAGPGNSGISFVASFGADGPGTVAQSLGIGGANGIVDSGVSTTDGHKIYLFVENGLVVGRVDTDNSGSATATDPAAFALAIDPATGELFVAQYLSLEHPLVGDGTTPAGSFDEAVMLVDGAVTVTVTVTDADGDKIASQPVGIGHLIAFQDSGPTLTVEAKEGAALNGLALNVDETDDAAGTDRYSTDTSDDGNPDGNAALAGLGSKTTTIAGGLAALFTLGGSFGADGGSDNGTLSFVGLPTDHTPVATNLSATHGGAISLVYVSATEIDGIDASGTGDVVFTLKIVSGQLELTQFEAINHGADGNLFDSELGLKLAGAGAVQLQYSITRTDGDGDFVTTADQINLITSGTSFFSFDDDGPDVNIVDAPSSVDEGQTINGTWTLAPGSDGVTSIDVTVDAVTQTLQLTPASNTVVFNLAAGTLTVDADGDWHFAANAVNSDQQVTFSIKATDGDGDFDADSQTITVENVSEPLVQSGTFNGFVEEEQLGHIDAPLHLASFTGIEDETASPDNDLDTGGNFNLTTHVTTQSFQVFGGDGDPTFAFNAAIDNQIVHFADGSLGDVTSQGDVVRFDVIDSDSLTGYADANNNSTFDAGDRIVFTMEIDNNLNNFTFSLWENIDHHPIVSADNLEGTRALNLNGVVIASDPGVDDLSLSGTVSVIDDVPEADDGTHVAQLGETVGANNFHLTYLVDVSASISDSEMVSALQAFLALTEAYVDGGGNLSVEVIRFRGSADSAGTFHYDNFGGTHTISELTTLLTSSIATVNGSVFDPGTVLGSNTNYQAGLDSVKTYLGTVPPADGFNNVFYFFTDGEPNAGSVQTQAQMINYLAAGATSFNDTISDLGLEVHAFGVGGVNATGQAILGEIDNTPSSPINIVNFEDLESALLDTVVPPDPSAGNVLMDGSINDAFGADGGHIKSIVVDGVTYTFNGVGAVDESGATPAGYEDHGTWILVPTAIGGSFVFYFADTGGNDAGDWNYTAPTSILPDATGGEDFLYTLIDGDGDTASAHLKIVIPPEITVTGTSVSEGAGADAQVFSVDLSHKSIADIEVSLTLGKVGDGATGGGTDYGPGFQYSLNGVDWFPYGGSVTIPAGSDHILVRTSINDDGASEPDESFTLTVNVVAGDTVNTIAEDTTTIIDNDNAAPTLALRGGEYVLDQFNSAAYNLSNGTVPWNGNWDESSETIDSPTAGAIQIVGGELRFGENGGNGATIERTVNLSGASTASLSYNVNEVGFDSNDGEQLTVYFAADGVNFTLVDTVNSATNTAVRDIPLTGPFTGTSTVRFVVTATDSNSEFVFIDNVKVSYTLASPITDYATSFTEDGPAVGIAQISQIADSDDTNMESATVTLTNAKAGDLLIVGTLPGGISISGLSTATNIILTGSASKAAYQTALNAITFSNDSGNPDTTPRVIHVTVNDGSSDSNVATTTIAVNAVNDAPVVSGLVVTETGISFNVTDPDNATLALAAPFAAAFGNPTIVNGLNNLTIPAAGAALSGTLQVTDGTATANVVGLYLGTTGNNTGVTAPLASLPNAMYGFGGNDSLIGGTAGDWIFGGAGNDTITGGGGADMLFGGANNDTFNLATGDFVAGELIDGGADTDTISLTTTGDGQSIDFTVGTLINVENLIAVNQGSSNGYDQTFALTAAQWAGLSTIDMNDGTDTLNVIVNGTVDVSAFGATTLTDIENHNMVGSSGADSITLTGAQLDAFIGNATTINLGGGTDTIHLTSTSTDLNGLSDGALAGVEIISAAGAGGAVKINLSNQTEAFTIIGGNGADTLVGGAGGDTLTGNGGADQFRLRTNGGTDIITDYVDNTDKIGFFDSGSNSGGSVNFANTVGSLGGTALNASDFISRATVSAIGNGDDQKVILITSEQTSSEIQNTTIGGAGSPDNNYVVVFNSTSQRGEIWFDTDWSSTAGRVHVATLDNVTTLAQLTAISASDVIVYNSVSDPIVLDLGNSGITLTGADQGVSFDMDADGEKENTGWTTGADGILVMDLDGSGAIENGNELISPFFNGGGFMDSVHALASLDGNSDGLIDSNDAAYGQLKVWIDGNHDGVSQVGELLSLTDLGIESIDVNAQAADYTINGQQIFAQGSFTTSSGETRGYVGVEFSTGGVVDAALAQLENPQQPA
jgi:Domain of unknown function (DUF5801)/RTX calcium-binding nonapeptide repeat (4 copies)